MTESKGHTELPWMAAASYSSVCGVPIVNREGRRVANTAILDMPKEWDELKLQAVIDAAFICKAVNTYPAVEELVKALEHCQSALAMVISPVAIKSSSVLHAFVQATEAECKARSTLSRFRSVEGGAND